MYTFSTLLAPVHCAFTRREISHRGEYIFTSSFLPCDLGLWETVSFAFDARVGALSECLIGGFQNPARWYCYRTRRLFEHPLGASTISAVNPGVSRIVILGFRHSSQNSNVYPSIRNSRDGYPPPPSSFFHRAKN